MQGLTHSLLLIFVQQKFLQYKKGRTVFFLLSKTDKMTDSGTSNLKLTVNDGYSSRSIVLVTESIPDSEFQVKRPTGFWLYPGPVMV